MTEAADTPLDLRIDGDTGRILLNRPQVRNCLSIELSDRFVEAVQDDQEVHRHQVRRHPGGRRDILRR